MADAKTDSKEKHHDRSADEGRRKGDKKPMNKDEKKKAVIAGGGIFIVLLGVGIYIYEKNKGTASTATTAAATTPGTGGSNGGGGWGGGSGGGSGDGGGGVSTGSSGSPPGTTSTTPPGTTSTTPTTPVPYDSAVQASLAKAQAALAKAKKSGNKTAIANATKNLQGVEKIQKSRTSGTNAGGTTTAKLIGAKAAKGGKTQINDTVTKSAVHSSGGTTKVSGATSTGKTVKKPVAPTVASSKPVASSKASVTANRGSSANTRSVSPSAKTPAKTTTTKKK